MDRGTMEDRIQTYEEFFPYYLSQHAKAPCRAMHYIGTTLGLFCWVQFALTLDWMWLGLGFVSGYAFAWFGHFFIEKNRPATFTYPLWSFVSDFRMYGLWITGRIKPAVRAAAEKHGVEAT